MPIEGSSHQPMDALDVLHQLSQVDQLAKDSLKSKKAGSLGSLIVKFLPAKALKFLGGKGTENAHRNGLEVLNKALQNPEIKAKLTEHFSKMTLGGLTVHEEGISKSFASAEKTASNPSVKDILHQMKATYNELSKHVGKEELGHLQEERSALVAEKDNLVQSQKANYVGGRGYEIMKLDHKIAEVDAEISDIQNAQADGLEKRNPLSYENGAAPAA